LFDVKSSVRWKSTTQIHYSRKVKAYLVNPSRGTMSTKRKYQESAPQGIVHASRQFQVPGSKPTKKPRRFEPPQPKIQAHASSVNAIKKRIRDVRRRLDHADDLPADVRIEDERALAAYEQELAAADAEKTKQKMIKKYHMVRFFGMISSQLHSRFLIAKPAQSDKRLLGC
jgi:hypothetical protein